MISLGSAPYGLYGRVGASTLHKQSDRPDFLRALLHQEPEIRHLSTPEYNMSLTSRANIAPLASISSPSCGPSSLTGSTT